MVTLNVINVSPTVNAGPDQMAVVGEVVTFTGTFTDPGTADTHIIQWQVEASNGQNVPDGDALEFSFTPNASGTYTLSFIVADDDNGGGIDYAILTVEGEEPDTYTLYMPVVLKEDTAVAQLPKWPLILLTAMVFGFVGWKRP